MEPGPGYDGVSYTLSILCLAHTLVLGFNSRDALLAWDARVRYSLGEGQWFGLVQMLQILVRGCEVCRRNVLMGGNDLLLGNTSKNSASF